ncbi:contact-dependent growth inhibition system immunity protein [Escherichia coli]|uniref:contact-dependent growth inhibition system immunity protein n=1 Tax=Escherichia coli TaxID=562 RepID=UPI0024DF386F|nr:contact-dependent growth inhibition system immunity protein [Escherichia coli]
MKHSPGNPGRFTRKPGAVHIHLVNDVITIRPSFHEKLEAWSGNRINESDYVVLPADSSPTEIGSGLRLALSRCKG